MTFTRICQKKTIKRIFIFLYVNVVTLNASYTDRAGNVGNSASSANYTIDTLAPTATITLNDTALQIGDTATVTITFSEAVNGFTLDNLTAANGVLSNLSNATTNANGSVTYTATFTPTVNIENTTNAISLNANYTDLNGNVGTTAVSTNYVVDTKAPKIGRAHV